MTIEVLDEDIEFVRKALADQEHAVKFHFDCMVDELNKLRAKVADAADKDEKIDQLESEVDDLKEQVKSLEEEREEGLCEYTSALETIKYWLHDALIFKRLTTDPMKMLRVVERALGA